MSIESKLFVTRISLDKENIPSYDKYPFNIEVIKNLDTLELNSQVTFFNSRKWNRQVNIN